MRAEDDRAKDDRVGGDRDDRRAMPGGRPRTAQAVTVALLIVVLLLAVFVLQNTQSTEIEFLVWSTSVPLAGALMLAAVLGGILAALVVYIRQRQFRRALVREQRAQRSASERLERPAERSDPDLPDAPRRGGDHT